MLLCAFCLGVVGCGSELPSTPMMVDAGSNADVVTTNPDGAVDNDAVPVTDAGTPQDRVQPGDTGPPAMICVPMLLDDTHSITCEGAAVCQPTYVNPTCAGAMTCDCNLQTSDMPAMLCTAETMPSCRAAVSCTVGRNHCSIHLPTAVDYAPFPMLDPTPLGRGGLRRTLGDGWISTDRRTEDHFARQALYNDRGFVQVCIHLPQISIIPSSMQEMLACAACSGRTCYWNRGATRASAPSFEIELSDAACAYELRVYGAGSMNPGLTQTMVSLGTVCN